MKITVFDEPDLSAMYRVDADGSLSFPLIGHVARRRPDARRAAAADHDDAGGRLPQEPAGPRRDQSVQEPVRLRHRRSARARQDHDDRHDDDAARSARAGRLTDRQRQQRSHRGPSDASRRRQREQPGAEAEGARITVNRKDLELGKAGQDVVLQDGDIINVPSAQHFYITGMVRNPGTFVLDPGITVQQAIALAGGLNERGSDRRIKVSRLVNGKLTEVGVELEDKIQPGDTHHDQRTLLLGSGSGLRLRPA